MKLFCCYTPTHEVLLKDYFIPSLPAGIDLHVIPLEGAGTGDYRTPEWMSCLHRKVDLLIDVIREHPGAILICSDIDIVFYRPVAAELEALLAASGKDILFQREGKGIRDINGGFYVFRSTERLLAFFQEVREELKAHPYWDDQAAINALLPRQDDTFYGYLPWSYYARTHGWPPPRDIALYHANTTIGEGAIAQKIRLFDELQWVRKYGALALAWSCVTKIPKRIKRLCGLST